MGWASSTGAGVGGGVMLSKARACWEVSEENSKVARVAWDVMDLKDSELGFSLKMFLAITSFRLEKKGRGGSGAADLVVLGVGGECRILVP